MHWISRLWLIGSVAATMSAGTVLVTDPFNTPGTSDVLGNKLQFDAESIQVTTGTGTLAIDIRTNFDNPHLYSFQDVGVRLDIGDVFFTVNGAYAYGVPLAYHNGPAGGPWGNRLYAGHVYQITDPSTALLTARQALHDPEYIDYRPDAIVSMIDLGGVRDVTAGTPVVQVLPIAGNDGVNGPLYNIRVNTSLPAGLFSSPAASYGVEFAVTTSGSDLVGGPINFNLDPPPQQAGANPAPEPSTLFLLIGAALIALSRLAVRRG